MKKYLIALIALLASNCLAQVSVQLASPGAGATVGTPFTVQASASSSHPIVGWHAYLDSVNVVTAGVTQSISASVNAGAGAHQLVVRAWDSTGAYGDQTVSINVGGGSAGGTGYSGTAGLPTPPAGAIVFIRKPSPEIIEIFSLGALGRGLVRSVSRATAVAHHEPSLACVAPSGNDAPRSSPKLSRLLKSQAKSAALA